MLPSGEWLCFACHLSTFYSSLIPLKGRFLCRLGLRVGCGEWLCFACHLSTFYSSLIPLKGCFLCRLGLRVGFLYRLGFSIRVSSGHFCIFLAF